MKRAVALAWRICTRFDRFADRRHLRRMHGAIHAARNHRTDDQFMFGPQRLQRFSSKHRSSQTCGSTDQQHHTLSTRSQRQILSERISIHSASIWGYRIVHLRPHNPPQNQSFSVGLPLRPSQTRQCQCAHRHEDDGQHQERCVAVVVVKHCAGGQRSECGAYPQRHGQAAVQRAVVF